VNLKIQGSIYVEARSICMSRQRSGKIDNGIPTKESMSSQAAGISHIGSRLKTVGATRYELGDEAKSGTRNTGSDIDAVIYRDNKACERDEQIEN
jgi:hypothetical protein